MELGLDSMSPMSLHSSLSDASGAVKGMSFGADHWTLKTEPMAGRFRMGYMLKWDIGCDWEMFLLGYWMWMGCGNGTLVGSEWGLNGI